jgi:hypothetical protein
MYKEEGKRKPKVPKHRKDIKSVGPIIGKFKDRGGLVDALLSVKTVVCLIEFVVGC